MSSSVRVIFKLETLSTRHPTLTFLWPDHALVFVIMSYITIASKMLFDTPLSSVWTLQIRFVLFVYRMGCLILLLARKLGIPMTTTPLILTTTLLLSVSYIGLIHARVVQYYQHWELLYSTQKSGHAPLQ